MSDPAPYIYSHDARSPRALIAVGLILVGLIVMRLIFDAAVWIVLPLGLLTLPAIYDIWRGHKAVLNIDATTIGWQRGETSFVQPLADLHDVRIKVGLDFSQKITLNPKAAPPVRIPLDCIPRGRGLEDALAARGVIVRRSFFG